MRVLKFGGKSLETIEKCTNICKFIKSIYKNEKQLIIVVSAMGNTTDKLLNLAMDFGYDKIKNKLTLSARRELSNLLSIGEMQSASLISTMLLSMGVPAKSINARDIEIRTFGDYLNGKISYINKTKINEFLSNEIVAVVTGFQGINNNNEITTLGRGGSDTTAVALASIYDTKVEIYSDYNGVFSGDPKNDKYKKFNNINYDSINSMANSGAKVLESRAIEIAKKFDTEIISKSSSSPNKNGTIISNIEDDIISINLTDNLSKITVIFSNNEKFETVFKTVIKCLKNYKIYNINYNCSKIEILINSNDKQIILRTLSKKLKLLK